MPHWLMGSHNRGDWRWRWRWRWAKGYTPSPSYRCELLLTELCNHVARGFQFGHQGLAQLLRGQSLILSLI